MPLCPSAGQHLPRRGSSPIPHLPPRTSPSHARRPHKPRGRTRRPPFPPTRRHATRLKSLPPRCCLPRSISCARPLWTRCCVRYGRPGRRIRPRRLARRGREISGSTDQTEKQGGWREREMSCWLDKVIDNTPMTSKRSSCHTSRPHHKWHIEGLSKASTGVQAAWEATESARGGPLKCPRGRERSRSAQTSRRIITYKHHM